MSWPAFRTPRGPQARLRSRDHLLASACALIGGPAIGMALMLAEEVLPRTNRDWPRSVWTDPGWLAGAVGYTLFFSVGAVVVGSVAAVPVTRLAVRFGLAGWLATMLLGLAGGAVAGLALGAPVVVSLACGVLAGLYWLGLRLTNASAFRGVGG